jgi:hypothetical protein
MTVLVVACAVVTALCVGYRLGRRSTPRPASWQTRTSRLALGKLAVSLVGVVLARRLQRSLFGQLALPAALGVWGYRPTARFQLLRGNSPRQRSRRR